MAQDLSKVSYGELRKMASKAQMKGIGNATRAQMEAHINGSPLRKASKIIPEKPIKLKTAIKKVTKEVIKVVGDTDIDRKKVIKSDLPLTVKICILHAAGMSYDEINKALDTTHAKGLLYNYTKRASGNSRFLKAIAKYKTL